MASILISDITGPMGPVGQLTRGLIPDATNIDTYRGNTYVGLWYIASAASAATILGLPQNVAEAGTFLVRTGPAGYGQTTQEYYPSGNNIGFYKRTSITSTTWGPWQKEATFGSIVPDGSNFDLWIGLRYTGFHYITSMTSANNMLNLPADRGPGTVLITSGPPGYGFTTQIYFKAGSAPAIYWRSLTGSTVWSDWVAFGDASGGGGGGGDPYEPAAVGMNNADLLAELLQRKGGPIGLAGRAGFALRIDHGTVAFRDFLGPLLKKYGITATMAVYSKQREINAAKNGVAWDIVESWHRTHGMSFGNHSDDHLDKPSASGWYGGTIGSAIALKALMPSVPIEQYIPHGSIGYDRYGGFNQANSHAAIVGTLAGRMALSTHALIAGYRGGYMRPLHGQPMQGLTHWSMEEATPALFKSLLNTAIAEKSGFAVMFHPEFVGLTGKISWEEVEECLAYVAQKRDEGVLVPLTLDGLACADSSSTHRHDLHLDPLLSDTTKWTSSGFTLNPGSFASSGAGASVYHDVSLSRKEWAKGGVRNGEWKVTSGAGATLTVAVGSAAGTWWATRTVIIPAGTKRVHLPFGIPLDMEDSLRMKITVDAGDATLSEAHLHAN